MPFKTTAIVNYKAIEDILAATVVDFKCCEKYTKEFYKGVY